MKANRPGSPLHPLTFAEERKEEGLIGGWVRFWFSSTDPISLHIIRVGAGLLLLLWLLPFAGRLDAFFGLQGWFDQTAYAEAARQAESPLKPAGWSALYPFASNPSLLAAAFWGAVAAALLFTLGVATRFTAPLAWVIAASFGMNPATDYEADNLLVILSFYLMLGYLFLGQRQSGLSLPARIFGAAPWWLSRRGTNESAGPLPSLSANLALRLIQVHFAIIMVVSGLHKLQSADWWSGMALWYPLHRPLETTLSDVQEYARRAETYFSFLSFGTYAVLCWQIGFPLFAWRRRWRPILLGGALIAWLGTAFLYRMPLFGPVMVVYCLAFVSAAEWRAFLRLASRLPGLTRLASLLPAERDEEMRQGIRKDEPAAPGRAEPRGARADTARSESITARSSGV